MSKRRKAREVVLQALYEAEFAADAGPAILDRLVEERGSTEETAAYARELFARTLESLDELDAAIDTALDNWELERVALVDKNILRFALAELMYFPEVPPKVVINEAIEIAHRFSTGDAGRFINGMLDRFSRDIRKDAV